MPTVEMAVGDNLIKSAKEESHEPGKLADLVILSDNPLKIDPMAIKDIVVEETIKEGKSIYRKG